MTCSPLLLASLFTVASVGTLGGSALAARPAPESLTLPAISADVDELAICSTAGTLRRVGLLDVPMEEVRDDRPLVVLGSRYALRYASWTRPGEETPTTSGELGEAAAAPLIERVDLSKDGCWFWTRS
ncbi:MAG: hypothetical protein KDA24_26495, partial [Deltaproteobacteria bacterium]|nr:hypothetical protein [Deltaproteobacteria bacterium]